MPEQHFPTTWRGLSVPKRGHSAEEYEDAYAAGPEAGRYAVADGASESSFAGLWAKLLVEAFTHPRPGDNWLASSRRAWAEEVGSRPLPWYADAKRAEGAFATFLGLVLDPPVGPNGGGWRALAVGDSCLFQVRDGQLIRAFPVPRSEDFSNRPRLLGSRPDGDVRQQWHNEARGDWHPGDCILLMTDALAHWFLRRHEAGQKPWHDLARAAGAAFADWVEDCRERDGLRNDDVTLVTIDL